MSIGTLAERVKNRYITPLLLQHQYGDLLAKNAVLKNIQKGKRCFIMGTGPSIKNQPVERLSGEQTFVVNTFWQHPQYAAINPKYYVVLDTYVFPSKQHERNAWTEDLIQRNAAVSAIPSTKLIFNVAGKNFIDEQKLFLPNEKYYLAMHGYFRENLRFNIDIVRVLPQVKNVIVGCVILAAYMGFEEIYLLGCEHSFLAQPSQRHYEGFKHFYETHYSTQSKKDVEYYALSDMPYERHIDHTKILFRNYRLLRQKLALINPQVRIFNATPNSFLDVFPPVDFSSIPF